MKKRLVLDIFFLIGFLVLLSIVLLLPNYSKEDNRKEKENLGIQAINLMYNFNSVYELDNNKKYLKEITTPEVYSKLTIDRTERAMGVYLKFRKKPVHVKIKKSTDSYVLYSLDSESIESTRKFILMFEVDEKGRISYIRESEIIDFTTN
jgi:hypothetical protein